jgi:glycosyltransferase involved in cell wall biosynthesis
MRISACVIAKDEADRIGPCLDSLAFCDEVLVLDSGSRDGTPDLCRGRGARVVETDWPGWVAQKNRAASLASHDWVLSLDADERLDEDLRRRLEEVRSGREPGADGPVAYEMRRRLFYMGRWLKHGGLYPEWRARLFDRRRARWGGGDPHDRIETDGPVERIRDGHIDHHSYRSLSDHLAKLDRFSTAAAEEMARRGKRCSLFSLLWRPRLHFLKSYLLRLGFLDGRPGLVFAQLSSAYTLAKYAKLWEMTRGKESG